MTTVPTQARPVVLIAEELTPYAVSSGYRLTSTVLLATAGPV